MAAALARRAAGAVVVVLPHAGEVDAFCDDLALFTGAEVERLPAWESDAGERVLHDEIFGERLRLLKRLPKKVSGTFSDRAGAAQIPASPEKVPDTFFGRGVIATSIQALIQPVPSWEEIAAATRRVTAGESLDLGELTRWLAERGCHGTSAVELPGEFSQRGGILDVFPPDAVNPLRIELWGDEVESIRTFDVATQRSLQTLTATELTVLAPGGRHRTHFSSYLPGGSWFMLVEPSDLEEEGRHYHRRLERPEDFFATSTTLKELYQFPTVTASGIPAGSYEATAHLQFESVEQFSGDVSRVRGELDAAASGQQVYLVCETEAEAERLGDVFRETRLAAEGRLKFVRGRLASGFRVLSPSLEGRGQGRDIDTPPSGDAAAKLSGRESLPYPLPSREGDGVVLISAAELFHRTELARPSSRFSGRAIDSFLQLREGDLVVHLAHGIGRVSRDRALGEGDGRRGAPRTRVRRGDADLCSHEQDRTGAEVRRRAQGQAGAGEDWRRQLAAAEEGG